MQILKDVLGFLMKLSNYFDEYCIRDVTTLSKEGRSKLNVSYIDLNCRSVIAYAKERIKAIICKSRGNKQVHTHEPIYKIYELYNGYISPIFKLISVTF